MITVCVVDDDLSVRKSLSNLLKAEGFAPCAFSSGDEFIASGLADEAACLVLDLHLKGLQGAQVLAWLAAERKPLAVVCMSAQWDDGTLAAARAQGIRACLRKPFTADTLLASIDQALAG